MAKAAEADQALACPARDEDDGAFAGGRDHTPRVLVALGGVLLGDLLAAALGSVGFRHVRVATDVDVEALVEEARVWEPEVVLLGPGSDGTISVPAVLALASASIAVLVLTDDRDPVLLAGCLQAGATGLFDSSQPFDQLAVVLRDAAMGHTVLEPWARQEILLALRARQEDEQRRRAPFWALSDVEAEVLALMTEGRHAEQIASARVVSLATVRSQIRSILRKLGVNSQLAAVVLAEQAGWPFGADNRQGPWWEAERRSSAERSSRRATAQ